MGSAQYEIYETDDLKLLKPQPLNDGQVIKFTRISINKKNKRRKKRIKFFYR